MKFTTKKCLFCKTASVVDLPEDGVKAWQSGMFVQNAFPRMSPPQRELLISGTHPACWDDNMKDED